MNIQEERIAAQNAINAKTNEIERHLLRILSDWQGMKARKVSGYGGFVQKLAQQLEAYNSDHGYNQQDGDWWLTVSASYTSILATVRNTKTAMKAEAYLARFNEADGVLTSIGESYQRRTDYTADGVNAALKEAEALEEKARQLRSSVREFVRH